MKAARLYDKGDIRIDEVPVPEINDNEILVRSRSAFICGTDVRFFKNGKSGINPQNPITLGHELGGVIEKVGPGVTKYRPGMRVAVAPNYGCGICDLCVSGNSQLCADSNAIGVTVDGAFAEFVKIPEAAVRQGNVVEIPESLSFEAAALAEPLSCVYNAYEKIGIYPGDKVLVIGAGPIGIMHVKVALMAGAAKVYVNDISEDRLARVKEIESEVETILTDDLKTEVMKLTEGKGMNVVITAASVAAIQEVAFSLVGMNGRVMFFGGLPKDKSIVSLDTNEIHYKQITVSGTTRQSLAQYRKVIELIGSGRLSVDELVTSSSKVEDISNVISNVASGIGLKSNIQI